MKGQHFFKHICHNFTLAHNHSEAKIILTKIRENFVLNEQNERIIHTSKPMGKHTIVRIIQDVRISEGQISGIYCISGKLRRKLNKFSHCN